MSGRRASSSEPAKSAAEARGWRWLLRPRSDPERWRFAGILALTLALMFLAVREVYGPHGYLVWRAQRHERSSLQRQVQQLQQEDLQLEQWNERLRQGDPAAIEGVARGQRMARPREKIYTYQDKPPRPPGGVGPNDPPQ